MSTTTKRLPLIELPIGSEQTRGLGIIEVKQAGKNVALPLASVDISASVADRVASVTVKQTYKNPYNEHLEAVYIFPLSGGCVVSDFELRVGARIVKGIVQERGEARQQYQQAIDEGKRAALLEQERDDIFTVQCGNIPPNEEVTVVMTYSERLPFFESGKTELRLPLVVSPRHIAGNPLSRDPVGDGYAHDTDRVPDASRITPPLSVQGLNPEVGLSIAVQLSFSDGGETKSIADLSCSQHATQIDIEDGAVRVELARSDERLNRDFVLQWRLATTVVRSSMLVYKDPQGQQYAMVSVMPPRRDGYVGAPRDVVFVVDRSGSMQGTKMVSAVRSCEILLSTLGPNDRFAIQAFDDSCEWLTAPYVAGRLSHWINADEAGIAKGAKFLRSIDARGGTYLDHAINEAFESIAARQDIDGRVPVVVVLTDGEVGDEAHIFRSVQTRLGETRLFAVGIDTSVNSGLLRRLANMGGGTATFVQPGTSLENALRSVGREIGEPLVMDLQVVSDGAAIENNTLAPNTMADLFEGRSVTSFVKITGKGAVIVRGKWADGKPFEQKLKARLVNVPAIAQLWAKSFITDLEDSFRLQPKDTTRKQIIDLAIRHSLLTKFTAFVAIDHAEIVNKDGSLKRVVQPVEAPAGWDMLDAKDQSLSLLSKPLASFASAFGQLAKPSKAKEASQQTQQGWGSPDYEGDALTRSKSARRQAPGSSSAPPAPASAPAAPSQQPAGGGGGRGRDYNTWSLSEDAEIPAERQEPGSTYDDSAIAGVFLQSASAPSPATASPAISKNEQDDSGKIGELAPVAKRRALSLDAVALNALTKFAALLEATFDEIKAGNVPDCTELEKLRKELLDALLKANCSAQVPLLQKFLRGGAVELVQSAKQAVDAATIHSLWERHMQAFDGAKAEATTQLNSGAGSGGKFWEASV